MSGISEVFSLLRASAFDALISAVERIGSTAPEVAKPSDEQWVLPPYPGEMGHEIRAFIGCVEPYLRAGWKILAKRPALYPPGTAIFDESYFANERRLFQEYDVMRWSHLVLLDSKNPVTHVQFRRKWRRLFAPYLLSPTRPLTAWDAILFSTRSVYNPVIDFVSIVPASYLPTDYIATPVSREGHIGLQMRQMKTAHVRNSDVKFMLGAAQELAGKMNLPLLIYGHPEGSHLPPEYACTAEIPGTDLLSTELHLLRSCKVMLAPDSGWTDLMGWLKIPTLVEKELLPDTFYRWERYGSRIRIIQKNKPIYEQARELLDAPLRAGPSAPSSRVASETTLAVAKAAWVTRGAR